LSIISVILLLAMALPKASEVPDGPAEGKILVKNSFIHFDSYESESLRAPRFPTEPPIAVSSAALAREGGVPNIGGDTPIITVLSGAGAAAGDLQPNDDELDQKDTAAGKPEVSEVSSSNVVVKNTFIHSDESETLPLGFSGPLVALACEERIPNTGGGTPIIAALSAAGAAVSGLLPNDKEWDRKVNAKGKPEVFVDKGAPEPTARWDDGIRDMEKALAEVVPAAASSSGTSDVNSAVSTAFKETVPSGDSAAGTEGDFHVDKTFVWDIQAAMFGEKSKKRRLMKKGTFEGTHFSAEIKAQNITRGGDGMSFGKSGGRGSVIVKSLSGGVGQWTVTVSLRNGQLLSSTHDFAADSPEFTLPELFNFLGAVDPAEKSVSVELSVMRAGE
jgi:hypothetical protein